MREKLKRGIAAVPLLSGVLLNLTKHRLFCCFWFVFGLFVLFFCFFFCVFFCLVRIIMSRNSVKCENGLKDTTTM